MLKKTRYTITVYDKMGFVLEVKDTGLIYDANIKADIIKQSLLNKYSDKEYEIKLKEKN